jgi:hypothetical protein
MAKGRIASLTASSFGTWGKSFLCQSGSIWTAQLTRNTKTEDKRMGIHNSGMLTIAGEKLSGSSFAVNNYFEKFITACKTIESTENGDRSAT